MENKDFFKKLGRKIKAVRTEKGMSQLDLADACGFEKSNMSRIESGNTSMSVKTMLKISKALDIHISELFNI